MEAIPVEVSPMTDFCIRYPNLIRKDMKIHSSRYLFDKLLSLKTIKWHKILENLGLLVSIYKKRILIIAADGLTKELCIGAYLVAKQVIQLNLNRRSGPLFTALYLKQAATCCKQAYAGVSQSHSLLPVPVSLTRSGYPKIIPSFHRKMIMKKDQKADLLVHIYLSLVFVGLFAWRNGLTDRY